MKHISYSSFALIDKSNIVQNRLDVMITEIYDLNALYASIKNDYDELHSSFEDAVRGDNWSHQQRALMKNHPGFLKWFGIDMHEWWGVPLKQKIRIREEAPSGVIAWNRESERLHQIALVAIEEGHKYRNRLTQAWASIKRLRPFLTLILSATPMISSVSGSRTSSATLPSTNLIALQICDMIGL